MTLMTAPKLDVARLRGDFPILSRKVYGKPLVYLDSAASAQKPDSVIETEARVYRSSYANINRSAHALAGEATMAYEAARSRVARFLNAKSADEIVFVRGATEAINLVAASFLRPRLKPGDEILLTELEHHSNIVPWYMAAEAAGARLKPVPVDRTGHLDLDDFAKAITPRTKMIAITHASNVLGTIVPIRAIVDLARQADIPVLVDGCQFVPHQDVDVQALDVDFYVFSGHKLYGPTGIGALYGKMKHLQGMPPYQGGGSMIAEVTFEKITYADPPARFEAGTPAIAQAIGLAAAIDYVSALDRAAIARHEASLEAYALERLSELNTLRIFAGKGERAAILCFEMPGVHAHDVATIVDREGVAVRAGHHCAQPLMRRLGVSATTRVSFGLYNTVEEVDVLVGALRKAAELFK